MLAATDSTTPFFTVGIDSNLEVDMAQQMQLVVSDADSGVYIAAVSDTSDKLLALKVLVKGTISDSLRWALELAFSTEITHLYGDDTVTYSFTPGSPSALVGFSSLTTTPTTINLGGHFVSRLTYVPRSVVTSVCSGERYRYSFDGQMKVNEWAGIGNHTTALNWEYDTRTGRRLNTDPEQKEFPGLSPYATNHNNPIVYSDPEGDFPFAALAKVFRIIKIIRYHPVIQVIGKIFDPLPMANPEATQVWQMIKEQEMQDIRQKAYSKSDEKLIREAEKKKDKEDKKEERKRKKENQTKKGKSNGKSNQRVRGEHDGKGNWQKHSKGNGRRIRDQKIKGPDNTV